MTPDVKKSIKFSIIGLAVLVIGWITIIPLFDRRCKGTKLHSMVSDGRILGNAAQIYFETSGKKTVTFTYNSITGALTGPLAPWLNSIDKDYTIPDTTIELGNPAAFTLSHPCVLNGQPVIFSDEGKTTLRPGQ